MIVIIKGILCIFYILWFYLYVGLVLLVFIFFVMIVDNEKKWREYNRYGNEWNEVWEI